MAKDLVIVESPAKARTVQRFLGSNYVAKASMGHVRDLPKKDMGVEIDDRSFEPTYRVVNGKGKIISELSKEARQADTVYLATDPDREGEAISWHLMEAAKIPPSKAKRVVFHEITRDAIAEAFDHPRELDRSLIDAQQARRVLDRIVGYKLSPVLWSKVRRGLSAGRVQSVALRLIVDREVEIDAFVPVEYWTIDATLSKRPRQGPESVFKARLHSVKGTRGRIEIPNQATSDEIVQDIRRANYAVTNVRVRETKSRPAPPFITSTLQQEAARKLRFSARRTMTVAQQLYEGLSIGNEDVGLITYMRTDSTNVAAQAVQETAALIRRKYGAEYAPAKPRAYTRKVRGAQEAHEAIRPTSVAREPESVRRYLSNDQARLYDLIWKRMVASQMSDALFDSTSVSIGATGTSSGREYELRATGSIMKFAGFRAVYMEGKDDAEDDAAAPESGRAPIPKLGKGEPLDCLNIAPEQHFTKPPPRFTDASLVKALEEEGIGRPSTYATIISTLEMRDYVIKEGSRFVPTNLGKAVTGLLVENFTDVMDVGFTAGMEEKLDDIAEGEQQWTPVIGQFYDPFEQAIEKAMKEAERVPREQLEEPTDEVCEECGHPMVIKSGRFGRFMACTGYPECKNTRPVETPAERAVRELVSEDVDEFCEKCERPMAVKNSQSGRFLGCTGYPECRNAKPLRVGVACEKCGSDMIERKQKGRNGRIFYGCINYPECKHTVNPMPQPCPGCGKLLVSLGRNRRNARCLDDTCGFSGPAPRFGDG